MKKYFVSTILALTFCLIMESPIEAKSSQIVSLKVQKGTPVPEFLYKVISLAQWQESLSGSFVVVSSMDKSFIHLSKEDQLAHVTEKFWKGQDYIILKLAPQKLSGELVYETNPGGSAKYYHLYNGCIPLDSVVEATVVDADKPT